MVIIGLSGDDPKKVIRFGGQRRPGTGFGADGGKESLPEVTDGIINSEIGRIPPFLRKRVSVLGSILIDNDAILAVSEFLRPEHFYKRNHAKIYEAMVKLYEARSPLDLVTVSGKL